MQEFNRDQLLLILSQNGYHSIKQSDSEDESQQKLLENKRFLHVYDHGWRSVELRMGRVGSGHQVRSNFTQSKKMDICHYLDNY